MSCRSSKKETYRGIRKKHNPPPPCRKKIGGDKIIMFLTPPIWWHTSSSRYEHRPSSSWSCFCIRLGIAACCWSAICSSSSVGSLELVILTLRREHPHLKMLPKTTKRLQKQPFNKVMWFATNILTPLQETRFYIRFNVKIHFQRWTFHLRKDIGLGPNSHSWITSAVTRTRRRRRRRKAKRHLITYLFSLSRIAHPWRPINPTTTNEKIVLKTRL